MSRSRASIVSRARCEGARRSGGGEAALGAHVGSCVGDPFVQQGPLGDQRLVGQLDGGPAGGGVAVEAEQPVAAERVDHVGDGVPAAVGELGQQGAPAGVLRPLAEAHQPQEDVTSGAPSVVVQAGVDAVGAPDDRGRVPGDDDLRGVARARGQASDDRCHKRPDVEQVGETPVDATRGVREVEHVRDGHAVSGNAVAFARDGRSLLALTTGVDALGDARGVVVERWTRTGGGWSLEERPLFQVSNASWSPRAPAAELVVVSLAQRVDGTWDLATNLGRTQIRF